MLKTNNKVFKERLKDYIVKGAQDCDYIEGETFEQVAPQIAKAFYKQELGTNSNGQNIFNAFKGWCQGLPSALNCDYYYNVSAVDLLGDMLEQTKEERAKYTESESEELITKLLYYTLQPYILKAIYNK